MKSVLISIKPKWCELIASGKKTVEVRKTRPKLDVPFKCYIYCTKGKTIYHPRDIFGNEALNGKVIGEFVCDKVVQFENHCYNPAFEETADLSCVGFEGLYYYLGLNDYGYGWHISDLVIYDKPKKLSEFIKPCNHDNDCCTCDRYDYIGHKCYNEVTRPPQSWCYVE